MTDDRMDARLRAAGEAWRTATAPAAEIESIEPEELIHTPVPRSRRYRTGLFASAAVVAAALVAGGSVLIANISGGDKGRSADTEGFALDGTVWRLVGYGNDQLMPNSFASLYISPAGDLVADDSCDLITGRVSIDNSKLAVTQPNVRYYNCTDSVGEVVFDPDVLTSLPTFSLDPGGKLTITGAGKTMHLVAAPDLPQPTADRPTFTDTDWRLVKATDADGTSHQPGSDLTFRVTNNQFQVKISCNTVSGELDQTGSQVDLKAIRSTALPCPSPQPVDEVLQAVFQPGRIQTQLSGARLTISRDGAGSLEYVWVPADKQATDPTNLTDRPWHLTSAAGAPVSDRVVLNVHADGTVTGYDGCRELDARAQTGPGTLTIDGLPQGDVSSANCNGDLATTVDSLLSQQPALWHVDDGTLVINGPGAQAFALVFSMNAPNAPPDQSTSLTGTEWRLVSSTDAAGNDVPVAGSANLAIAADGTIKGEDGCNSITGSVQIADHTLDFGGGIGSTAMYCSGAQVQATEHQVLAVLKGQVTWSIEGAQLTLTKDGAGTLVYRSDAPPSTSTDPNDLVGVTWDLVTIQSGMGPDATAQSVVGDANLRIDGNLQYTDGCNTFSADASVDKGTLEITNRVGSAQGCIGATGGQAGKIDAVLTGTVTWVVQDGRLSITKDGVGALSFERHGAPTGLAGTTWTLNGIEQDQGSSGSGSGSSDMANDTIHFDGAGHLEITHRCYSNTGDVAVGASTITITNVTLDRAIPCPGSPEQAAEQKIDAAIDNVLDGQATWTTTGEQLRITKDGMTLVFSRKPESGGGGSVPSATASDVVSPTK